MRILSVLASALLLVLGLTLASPSQAHGPNTRVWVSIGDVVFSAGHPYHRHLHHPLQVVHVGHSPRYYYAPPPPRPHHYRERGPARVYGHSAYPPYYSHHYRHPDHRASPPRPGYPRHRPGYGR
jgi:hypothetical protein